LKEWVSVVSDDIVKSLLHAAELGCALGEPWLVYNAACSLWNYSHDWAEISEGHLITTCRQLLPVIKQIDLGRYIIAIVIVTKHCMCYALDYSNIMVKLWMQTILSST
jgi:hypothetical protein